MRAMRMKWSGVAVVAMGLMAFCARPSLALINPLFTPKDLVKAADPILKVELSRSGKTLSMKLIEAIKGAAPKDLTLEVDASEEEAVASLPADKCTALVFLGQFTTSDAAEANNAVGCMSVNTGWFALHDRQGGGYSVRADKKDMSAVWAGATDMLERGVRYALAEGDGAAFPVKTDAKWRGESAVAQLKTAIAGLSTVELGADSGPILHVRSATGDRLFAHSKGAFTDITRERGLGSTSLLACWADLDGDGRLDLVSWDGKQFVSHVQNQKGQFEARKGGVAADRCTGLVAVGMGSPATAAIAAAVDEGIVLLTLKDGLTKAATLAVPAEMRSKLGAPGPIIAGDFDGDGQTDLVQAFEEGLVAWAGDDKGQFAPAKVIFQGTLGKNLVSIDAADLDNDGLLDIVLGGKTGTNYTAGASIMANRGGWKFTAAWSEAGEIYKIQTRIASVQVCDINGDGRPDLMMGFERSAPAFMFNRGFRTFGTANELTLAGATVGEGDNAKPLQMSEKLAGGAPFAVVADFDGDGAQDLACANAEGEVWVVWREPASCRGLTVALPPGAAGPQRVVASIGKRVIGAMIAAPGRPAYWGFGDPGGVKLEWIGKDGKPASKVCVVEEAVTRFVLKD